MADEINSTLRAELNAALGTTAPQLRGLRDIAVQPISADLQTAVQAQIVERQRRVDLINAVLASLDNAQTSLDALEADGYPELAGAVMRGHEACS